MITETIIEEIIGTYEANTDLLVQHTSQFMEEHPTLLAYLEQESNTVLLDEEKDLQWYILVVCISAIERAGIELPTLEVEALEYAEEQNWEVLDGAGGGKWRERVTPFFEDYEQEDLLAFVEDMVELDEDSPITAVGREVIFITVKSALDCMV